MLHSLFYLETALHVSGGTITRHQERNVERFPDKINCVTLHPVGYILKYYYNARTHER